MSFPFANIGSFLSIIILDTILIIHGQTKPTDFAVIYICLFVVIFSLSRSYKKIDEPLIQRNIILLWLLMLVIISFEYLPIVFSNYITTRQCASLLRFVIKCIGLCSSVICFLCLLNTKKITVYREFIFLFSFIVLTSSICIFIILHSTSLDRTLSFWWVKYGFLEGGIILVGTFGPACFSTLVKRNTKI